MTTKCLEDVIVLAFLIALMLSIIYIYRMIFLPTSSLYAEFFYKRVMLLYYFFSFLERLLTAVFRTHVILIFFFFSHFFLGRDHPLFQDFLFNSPGIRGLGNTRKRTNELIEDVTLLLTFTGEIENSTKLALCNKFNNGKRFLTMQTTLLYHF